MNLILFKSYSHISHLLMAYGRDLNESRTQKERGYIYFFGFSNLFVVERRPSKKFSLSSILD